MLIVSKEISPKESPAGSKSRLTVPTEISPKESPSGSKSKLNKKDSLEEKEKRGSKVSRSKSSVEKLDKTAKTPTSLPLGDSKTYESPLTTALKSEALKSDPKKYTSRKKTAPIQKNDNQKKRKENQLDYKSNQAHHLELQKEAR